MSRPVPHFTDVDLDKIVFEPPITCASKKGGVEYTAINVKYGGGPFRFMVGPYTVNGRQLDVSSVGQTEGKPPSYRLLVPLDDADEQRRLFKKFLTELDQRFVSYCTETVYDDSQAASAVQPYRKGTLVHQPRVKVDGPGRVKYENVSTPRLYAGANHPDAPLNEAGKRAPPTVFALADKTPISWKAFQKLQPTGYLVFGCNRGTVTISSSGLAIDFVGMIIETAIIAPILNALDSLISEQYQDPKEAAKLAATLRESCAQAFDDTEEVPQNAVDDEVQQAIGSPMDLASNLFS